MKFTIQRQLTVALENYPGRLAAVSKVISEHNINIEAISLVDNIEQGVIRLITSEPTTCKNLLLQEGFYVIEADVIALEIIDSPGLLARIAKALADAKINIEYTYGSTVSSGEKMRLMVKVSDVKNASQILSALEV
ncbi:MAG: ACT domain-containing protein [Calothrix sp. MO_192.B10]|nr:ACT domain-containing protein [Calothrix sp. MO_192.B10]